MSILITGGAGFIGSHLCEHFTARGQKVVVLDNLFSGSLGNFVHPDLVQFVQGDVADARRVAPLVAEAEVVFHLAAIASVQVCTQHPELATQTNVDGTQTVFDEVAKTGKSIPIVYASSAAVYGDNPNLPLSEAHPSSPISLYGQHKHKNELIAAQAFSAHGVNSVGLRFFNVYGARQDPSSPYSGVISKFVERAQAKQPFTLFGDGQQSRDFVYVGDVVRALTAAAARANGAELFNVGTGKAVNLVELANTISSLLGAPAGFDYQPPRQGDIRHSLCNPAAVMAALGITGWMELRAGLKEMLDA